MTEPAGALVPSISIANLLQQRDFVVERIGTALGLLLEAQEMALSCRIADVERYRGFAYILEGNDHYRRTDLLEPKALETITKRIDASAWDLLMRESGIQSFMDAKARKEWRDKIDACDTPALNEGNIKSTFEMLYSARGDMFDRGVIRCFKNLSWDYKTNRPFAFGKRIVKFVRSGGYFSHDKIAELADLERCFCILDGKPEEDQRVGLYHRLYEAQRLENSRVKTFGVHDDIYMHFRWFKNGNAHITFKRMDLVAKMNRILAKHYPTALAHDPHTEAA